jgi:hypothetical protein
MPPMGGGASPSSAIDDFGAGMGAPAAGGQPGAGVDQQRAQLQAFMGRLRELDQQIAQVFNEMPALQPIAQQMKQLLKRAVQESVKTASPQSGSSEAVPTASQ